MALKGLWAVVNKTLLSQCPKDTECGKRRPLFTSLGLAVIDDIHFGSGDVVKDVLGGSATFCEWKCSPLSPRAFWN